LTFDDTAHGLSNVGLPQLYFDQLQVVQRHKATIPSMYTANVANAAVKLTRRRLLLQPDWSDWEAAEFKQLDAYDSQGMFGTPTIPPPNASLFYWVWVYVIKVHENNRKKARAVCDGSTRGSASVVHGNTYAPTPDMVDFRIFVALAAKYNLKLYCADVTNAFAEAARPKQQYFMKVDAAFSNWWKTRHPSDPLLPGAVIPICKNLQGHPEAPRQWSMHCDIILQNKLHFAPTTHAPCLYHGTINDQPVFFLRQVDDFGLACSTDAQYTSLCDMMDDSLSMPITRHGSMVHFNGLDIVQSATYISVTVEKYLDQIFQSHGWSNITPKPTPIISDNAYIRKLDTATPLAPDAYKQAEQQRFRYRSAIGELIWPMVCARPDLAFPVVKLSQFSTAPAACHYDAIYHIFQYLHDKRHYGITFTRQQYNTDLPQLPLPPRLTDSDNHAYDHFDINSVFTLHGYSDSDWAMDIRHRRSISGIILKLSGGAIAWKCRVQPTVSLSSTEAEFLAASDAGRLILYIRSVLTELEQTSMPATPLYEDNQAALLMSQASQPTRQTRHIDIRHFALLNWVETDVLRLVSIATASNPADLFTKQLPRILFTRHLDNISGRLTASQLASSLSVCSASIPSQVLKRGGVSVLRTEDPRPGSSAWLAQHASTASETRSSSNAATLK
jgi:hypothetical protein